LVINRTPSIRVVRFFYSLIKECAMRLKLAILLITTLTFLTACQGRSIPITMPPMATPSITGLDALEVDPLPAESIRQRMGVFLRSNPYTQFESGSQLLLYLVSSGEFDQAEITLGSGEIYQGDVLYAYALMTSQRVLVVPVLIGLLLPDGSYIYFSENYSFNANGGISSRGLDRQAALADARERLPRGRIFRLLAYGMATRQGLDWKRCPSVSLYPPEICPVGELVEQMYPKQTRAFVLRLADKFPTDWLLIGWVFQEFAQEELVSGASIDVPLP
jgi:hypothetical protein